MTRSGHHPIFGAVSVDGGNEYVCSLIDQLRPTAAAESVAHILTILTVEMTGQKDHWWNGLWPLLIPGVYFLVGLWGYYVSSPG